MWGEKRTVLPVQFAAVLGGGGGGGGGKRRPPAARCIGDLTFNGGSGGGR